VFGQFQAATVRAIAMQQEVLLAKIRRNADSGFGRDYHFDRIHSQRAFQSLMQHEMVRLHRGEENSFSSIVEKVFRPMMLRLRDLLAEGMRSGELVHADEWQVVYAALGANVFYFLSAPVVGIMSDTNPLTREAMEFRRKMSVEFTWVDPDDLDAWRRAVRPNTKAFYGETIGNPGGNVLDIEAVAALAHAHGAPLIVDNTFATPYLCRPIEWGADIVIHSATKFIGGHGTSIGGVVVDSGGFDWSNGRFPVIAEPSSAYHGLQFHETFGMYGYLMKLRAETLRDLGAAMSPFNAFLFLQGLETLSLRMERHVQNAAAVASYLSSHDSVERVTYPGLPTSRYRALVDKYLPRGAGAIFSFDCRGGRDAGQEFIRGVTLWSHLANVGDSKSLIIHPGSTTHRQLNDDELRAAGVAPGTIRLSVGTESIDDLLWDLDQGFAAVARASARTVASR